MNTIRTFKKVSCCNNNYNNKKEKKQSTLSKIKL